TNSRQDEKENRYARLMNQVIRKGVKTKVLMLSATPVNNRFSDLRNQLALAYEGDSSSWSDSLNLKSNVENIFKNAQGVFNVWKDLPEAQRTTQELLNRLSIDFIKLLDSVTIARSRKHIQTYYDVSEIGTFPKRNKPISICPDLTNKLGAITYDEIFRLLCELKLTIYTPLRYVLPSKIHKYLSEEKSRNLGFGREQGTKELMAINLLKRMESSVHSFLLTSTRIYELLTRTQELIQKFKETGINSIYEFNGIANNEGDFDYDDQNTDFFVGNKKLKIDLNDMDYISWERDINNDIGIFKILIGRVKEISAKDDLKLSELIKVISEKIAFPINKGNKKILIFTAFSDTAEYLYENISSALKESLNINTALITGSVDGKTTINKFLTDMNRVLACFSPVSKERDVLYPNEKEDIDVLIATDCISEGQNLQDCDFCINYDIHWNPVRIIQRFGRIDRIGSKNETIQLVNFWPNVTLDEYINLKERVETRMRIAVMTATGDDDLVNPDEKGDLEYRRKQLEKLQEEVCDIEEMTNGVSIMDLGLNEFRMDLLSYIKEHGDIERMPFGIHGVVSGRDVLNGQGDGVIFILKNVNKSINIKNQNRLHPFYMVYVGMNGEIITNHLNPKETLDIMRHVAKGKNEVQKELCKKFNKATNDGKKMDKMSKLLEKAIMSIIDKKEESDVKSFFSTGKTTFQATGFSGVDDFELICFMVVM
ncbi:MAG: DEAD/DEAH box helicase, partial [Pseudomonadota bacterium]|nr:DEAD/DEAH box helicase [Pseudomonadota bacterium]